MAAATKTVDATPDVLEVKDVGALPAPPKDGKGDAADAKNALDGHHEVPPLMRGNAAVVLNAVPDPAVPGEKEVLNTAAEQPESLQERADDDTLSSLERGVVVESDFSISETSTDGETSTYDGTSTDGDLETGSSDSTEGTETEDSDMEDP